MTTPTILAAGLFDTAKGLVNDAQTLLNVVVVLVVCVLVLFLTMKGGFSFGKLILNALAGAFVIFLVTSAAGMIFFSKQISDTVKSAPAPITHVLEHEGDRRV